MFFQGKFFQEGLFSGIFPWFFFHWQELFFAGLENWAYWQRGATPDKSWTYGQEQYGQMLVNTKKKSKGQKRVQRGKDRGYSTTERAPHEKMLPPAPRGDASATVGNPAFSKAGSVPASVPDAVADAGGAPDASVPDPGASVPESNVPHGVLAIAKREAHGVQKHNTPFVQPYAFRMVSWFFLGKDVHPSIFFEFKFSGSLLLPLSSEASGFRLHSDAAMMGATMMGQAFMQAGPVAWSQGLFPGVPAEAFQAAMVPGQANMWANLLAAMMGGRFSG